MGDDDRLPIEQLERLAPEIDVAGGRARFEGERERRRVRRRAWGSAAAALVLITGAGAIVVTRNDDPSIPVDTDGAIVDFSAQPAQFELMPDATIRRDEAERVMARLRGVSGAREVFFVDPFTVGSVVNAGSTLEVGMLADSIPANWFQVVVEPGVDLSRAEREIQDALPSATVRGPHARQNVGDQIGEFIGAACAATPLDVELYVALEVSPDQVAALDAALRSDPAVLSIDYLDADEAYAKFMAIFADQPEVTEGILPSDLPTSYVVTLRPGADVPAFEAAAEKLDHVDKVLAPFPCAELEELGITGT